MKMRKILRTLVASSLLTASLTVFAQDLPRYIIPVNPNQAVPTLSNAELRECALPIFYQVNHTAIQNDEPNYQRLIRELERLQAEGYTLCRLVVVSGSASPDGTYKNNAKVAARRAKALADSLGHHITLPTDIDLRNVAEDYDALRQLVLASDYMYREDVSKVIGDNHGKPITTKNALRALKSGRVWRDL